MPSAPLDQVRRYLEEHRPTARTLAGARAYVDVMVAMEPALPDVAAQAIVVAGLPAERLTPEGADLTRTLLYFHGGGYALGSATGYRPFTSRIAKAFGGVTVVVEYRLAPEHPFPAGIEDAVAATRALLKADPRLVLGGDSAGGGLALATLLSLRDAGEALPKGAALLSPWVDLEATAAAPQTGPASDPIVTREGMQNLAQLYLGDRDRQHPLASPTHAVLAGLPPLLILAGGAELQHDDVVAFVAKLRAEEVPVEFEAWSDMLHVFPMFPVLPEAALALDRVGSFLRERF